MKRLLILSMLCVMLMASGAAAQNKTVIVGDEMPGFYLKDINGASFFVNDYIGDQAKNDNKAIIISLSASWCKPCKKEIPELQRFKEKYGEQGLEVFIVALEKENRARQLIEETETTLPVLVDKYLMVPKLLGKEGIPFTLLVDRSRKIRYINTGFSEDNAHEFIEPFERKIIEVLGE